MSTNQTAEGGAKTFDLSRVHEVNLKMLKEIDRICRKHGIQYALDSGTLLGAIRHQGFIPWDDDVDVMFTRKNYEKFARVARRELPPGMSFVEPNEYHDGTAFYDFVPRLIYENYNGGSAKLETCMELLNSGVEAGRSAGFAWICSSPMRCRTGNSQSRLPGFATASFTGWRWDTAGRSTFPTIRA